MSSSRPPSVLWREGMLLCPQHLQAFARELNGRLIAGDAASQAGSFGALALRIDEKALERDVFLLIEGEFLMRDGTWLALPGNAAVEQREFGEHFTEAELQVYLGVQAVQANVPQIGSEEGRSYRHGVEVEGVPDENQRDAYKELEFKRLRARLFFGEEDRSGFETLPIARLVRRGEPQAHSALSDSWIGPVLSCGASAALVAALVDLASRARSNARDLAARVPALAKLSSVERGADIAGMLKLQALNPCVASLEHLAKNPSLHPYYAYLELARTAGNLAVFSPDRVVPEVPAYDHAEPFAGFSEVLEQVRNLLAAEVAVPYDTAEFQRDEQREGIFECTFPDHWAERNALFHMAIEMDKSPEETAELVGACVKLIPPSDADRVIQGVVPGIELEHERNAPTSFPKRDGLHFFRVVTEGRSRDAWLRLVESRQAMLLSALGSLGEVRYHFYVELPD
ncbi:MAG TPA: type VI secretion system baseplate subunit TssK [Planctomycetota bacterium]|nr:type VI secretion system baseplate subunit TssK [Planctomycetota bacterium]